MAQAAISIEVKGVGRLSKALKALGEADAPFIREAVEEGAKQDLGPAVRSRAPGSMARVVEFGGVKRSGANVRALVVVKHPGSKAMEFGRTTYYRGFTGRKQKATGTKFKASPGQKARPYVGIKTGGQAYAAAAPKIATRLGEALEREWERLAGGSG